MEEFANTEKVRDLSSDSLDIRGRLGTALHLHEWEVGQLLFRRFPKEARPRSGVVVCGYSGSIFLKNTLWSFRLSKRFAYRPPKNGQQDFGANWWGATDAIVRFHFGRDDRLFQILKDRGMEAAQKIEELSKKLRDDLQYQAFAPGDAARRRHRLR